MLLPPSPAPHPPIPPAPCSVLYMSSRVIGAAHRFLVSYRERLAAAGFGPFDGGDTPSSGFIAVYLMLQACNNVTLYGFGLDAEDGQSQQYHYFHIFSPKHSKKKNSMNKVRPASSYIYTDLQTNIQIITSG